MKLFGCPFDRFCCFMRLTAIIIEADFQDWKEEFFRCCDQISAELE
jgi:hypothetical protein